MIDRINNNQPLGGASSMFQNSRKVWTDKDLDVSINGDYSSLVEMAVKSSQNDENIIEQARESILTGELETPENILSAAENIITFGI